jgi:hypothetical protein
MTTTHCDGAAGADRAGQWLRYPLGVLIPVLSGLAAAGLTALMVGATTNLLIGYNMGAAPR